MAEFFSRKLDEVASTEPTPTKAERPYQGLRAFEPSDRRFFCGRAKHVGELLQRLHDHRFVSVVGLSGSGKSSLVRAGVIPELQLDRLKNTSSDWLIAMTTPETAPLLRMGDELKSAVKAYHTAKTEIRPSALDKEGLESWDASVSDMLNSGSLGLTKAIATAGLHERTRVLLVVDQFEELFRYDNRDTKDEAEGFIRQLLEITSDPDGRTYVVITMRSQYLGKCASFQGLAEAVNAGLYLTPRLNREQLREAITLPAERCGRHISKELVRRLVNDVANDQDQLPVLQHALMRCWETTLETGAVLIDEAQYDAVGGAKALDQHAEKLYKRLGDDTEGRGPRNQEIAKALFKRITKLANREGTVGDAEKEPDGERDPATLEEISSQTGFKQEELVRVMRVFRERDCAFLRPIMKAQQTDGTQLEDDLSGSSMIDITHESLIRKWDKLGGWVIEEAKSADLYKQLVAEDAVATEGERLSRSKVGLYLGEFRNWNSHWAERYRPGTFDGAFQYFRESSIFYVKKDAEKKAEEQRKQEAEAAEALKKQQEANDELLRRQEAEAAEALRKQDEEAKLLLLEQQRAAEEEARKHQLALEAEQERRKAEQEQRRQELAKWKDRALWVTTSVVLAAVGASILYSGWIYNFVDLIQKAHTDSRLMDERVPAAVNAGFLARSHLIFGGTSYLKKHLRLDQLELFAALRAATAFSGAADSHLRSGSGVTLDREGNFAAVADREFVRMYSLKGTPLKTDTWELKDADRVKLNDDGTLLAATAHAESGKATEVMVAEVQSGKLTGSAKMSMSIPNPVLALSFRKKSRHVDVLDVLTDEQLIEISGGKQQEPVDLQKYIQNRATLGVFSTDGQYLLVCRQIGRAHV